jgi:hypothetical protein
MTAPPIVGGDLWAAVVERAGGRCECAGACGQAHKRGGGRCDREQGPGRPLHAVPPADAGLVEAMRLGPDQLTALCDGCHRLADAARARQLRERGAADSAAAPTLLDVIL